MGIAVIDTRECPQTPTRLTSVPLCSSEHPNGLAAHQETYLNPPTAVWWPPGCPVVRAHSNKGLRITFCRMKTKPGAKEAGAAPASNAPGFVFIRQKMMRSPLFECAQRPDIARSGRVTRILGLIGATRVNLDDAALLDVEAFC